MVLFSFYVGGSSFGQNGESYDEASGYMQGGEKFGGEQQYAVIN